MSEWLPRLTMSSVEIDELRRKWGEAGRRAFADAIRTGEDVLARTQSEIEALGRARLEEERLQRAQQEAVSAAAATVARRGARQVRRSVERAADELQSAGAAQLEADELRRTQDRVVARSATGAVKTAGRALRPGTSSDPGPGRLVSEWVMGVGPEKRVLSPESSFSREFVEAPSVQRYVRGYVDDWRQRDGGVVGAYANPAGRRAKFGATEFMDDLAAGNGASHFVGTWGVDGKREGSRIDWEAKNDTDPTSFFYGRPLREVGLPSVPWWSRPWPGGRTHQTIQFSTDLEGRPFRPR